MRKASDILKAIREEVFVHSQGGFAETLGYSRKETICRLESGKPEHRLSFIHLEKLRGLKPPPHKADAFQALLQEFEEALRREAAGPSVAERAPGATPQGVAPGEGRSVEGHPAVALRETAEARQAEEALRAEQLRQADEARRAEEALRREEAPRHLEALTQRTEQVFQAAMEWWAQQVPRFEDALRQAQAMVSGAEQRLVAWWAEEVKQFRTRADAEAQQHAGEVAARAKEATDAARLARESAERAEQTGRALMQRVQQWVLVGISASMLAVAGGVVWGVLLRSGAERSTASLPGKPEPGSRELARQEQAGSTDQPEQPEAPEEGWSRGQNGGSASVRPIIRASPLPKGGVPGQRHAPCPEFADVFDGRCWTKVTLTSEQVRGGVCDDPKFYEPSEGWCVAHHAAYRPLFAPRPRNAEKK